jgi:hypothetical protein
MDEKKGAQQTARSTIYSLVDILDILYSTNPWKSQAVARKPLKVLARLSLATQPHPRHLRHIALPRFEQHHYCNKKELPGTALRLQSRATTKTAPTTTSSQNPSVYDFIRPQTSTKANFPPNPSISRRQLQPPRQNFTIQQPPTKPKPLTHASLRLFNKNDRPNNINPRQPLLHVLHIVTHETTSIDARGHRRR